MCVCLCVCVRVAATMATPVKYKSSTICSLAKAKLPAYSWWSQLQQPHRLSIRVCICVCVSELPHKRMCCCVHAAAHQVRKPRWDEGSYS